MIDMETIYPSIFNDVIGPVMRGPSSSHCAAGLLIGRMARDLMDGNLEEILIRFDLDGSLATTHHSQGSDMGLFGGFLGWEAYDERLTNYQKAVEDAGIKITIEITRYGAEHPNTYKLTLKNNNETHEMTAVSIGGGMIEVTEIDGVNVSMAGDYYETLVYIDDKKNEILDYLKGNITADHILVCEGKTKFIQIKAQTFLDKKILSQLRTKYNVSQIKEFKPVLPILSRRGLEVPFSTCEEMLKYNEDKNLDLWELAACYESARGNISENEVFEKMKDIVKILKDSVREGLEGTEYKDRILGPQSGLFKASMENKQLLDAGMLNRMTLYITALMEMKSSMGVIVAAPTAGACAGLPGACIGVGDWMGLSDDEITKAMLAAGMIGVFISAFATFSAEVGGCQAECGAGSGMAAAALVVLGKGSTKQAVDAASIALQNSFGMVCDPVANRVEVPCLGKNVMAAANALSCANMAMANFDAVIPLDEVINAMDKVGKSLPFQLRCTALGGLSVTKTSKEIEKRLNKD
jgi:L-serine dehydratase